MKRLEDLEYDLDYRAEKAREKRHLDHYKWHVAKYLTIQRIQELDRVVSQMPYRQALKYWQDKLAWFIREF